MAKYIFKRMLSLIPVLIVVSLLVFLMVHMMPGDPARLIAGEQATTEEDRKSTRLNSSHEWISDAVF